MGAALIIFIFYVTTGKKKKKVSPELNFYTCHLSLLLDFYGACLNLT